MSASSTQAQLNERHGLRNPLPLGGTGVGTEVSDYPPDSQGYDGLGGEQIFINDPSLKVEESPDI